MADYPVVLTRDLNAAKSWLREQGRGLRRYGLVASSGARRLRADGLGLWLSPNDGSDIAHWYLRTHGDIRSSLCLEVPANEYACQGLELDFVGVCWGGDLVRAKSNDQWTYRKLRGDRWTTVSDRRRFIENAYRVLLTRAREGLVIWVPEGDALDSTRQPDLLDATAEYLLSCGARSIDRRHAACQRYSRPIPFLFLQLRLQRAATRACPPRHHAVQVLARPGRARGESPFLGARTERDSIVY